MTTTTMPDTTGESLSAMMETGAREGGDKHYFGQITIVDDWDCALVRGAGKVPFDPAVHTTRLIALKLQVTCQTKDGGSYTLDQDDITSGSKHLVTLPSLDALGVKVRPQLKALAGKYCEVVRVPTGKKYPAKKDSADGKIKAGDMLPEQALKFLRLFDTAEQAQAAEREFYTPRSGAAQPAPAPAQPVDQAARATLLTTLPILWQAAQQKPDVFAQMLAGNPAYAQAGITTDSDEVVTLTGITPF